MSVFISQYTNVLIINGINTKLLSGQHLQAYRHTPAITRKRLSCNAKRAFRHTGRAFPATRKGAIGMPTTVKQWNNGVITARQHVQNGGVTYRQSQGGTCKTVHFIGVRQLTGKAERHLGTLKRDATYVKSVKRERHFHSLQQYFISTSLPPFSGIITVVSACMD